MSPVRHSYGPFSNRPNRILGPWRSARMPTARPEAAAASRTRRYTFSWSSWLPWLKLSRATSMPASTRPRIRSGEEVAGPSVQTIFARRVTRTRLVPSVRAVSLGPPSPLTVNVLVTVVERVDVGLGNGQWVAQRARDVNGARDVLTHHRGLHRVAGGPPDRENSMAAHQDGLRPVAGQGAHDALADVVAADQRERADRDLRAELVGHAGQHARDRFAAGRPRRGVRAVRVHHAADVRHRPVDVRVRGRVTRWGVGSLDHLAVE